MSLKNRYVIEQLEDGWRNTKGRVRRIKKIKKMWSKLRRKSKETKQGFLGFEY